MIKCAMCGCEVAEDKVFECEECGALVCEYCIMEDSAERIVCDACYEELEAKYVEHHGFLF